MITGKQETVPIKIVGGSNFARYPKTTDEKTVNMMVTTANDISSLVDNSGYTKCVVFPVDSGEPRKVYISTRLNEIMTVIGNTVYLIDASFSYRRVGNIDTFEGRVYIAENLASQIAIVDGLALYIYNYSLNTFARIDIPDVTPSYVSFLDTYFIITDANTGIWQISGSDDGTMYDPLMIAFLQTEADNLQCVIPLNRTLWVMGKKVAELWNDNPTGYNASGVGNPVSFPFQRNNTFAIDYGVMSVPTVISGFQKLVWLAFNADSGPTIVYTDGGQPTDMSTDGLDYFLKTLNNPEKSIAHMRKENGHIIYQITFYDPSDNVSIQYDFDTKLWTHCTDENQNFHIASDMVFYQNQQYFINFDPINPALYIMSAQITTFDGHVIPRIRICPPIRFKDKTFVVKNVEIQLEQGQTSDPRYIDMSLSKDGGVHYGNTLRYTMQPVGHRQGRVNFWNLGLANDLRIQLTFLSLGRFVVLDATANILA